MKITEASVKLLLDTIKHSYELGDVRDEYIQQLETNNITHPLLLDALGIFYRIEIALPYNTVNRADIHTHFEDWLEEVLDEQASSTYNPYSDPKHEIYWMVWYGLALKNGPSNLH